MNMSKMTEKAQEAVLAAQEVARDAGHPEVEPEHVLVTLIDQKDGVVPGVLRKLSVDPSQLLDEARSLLSRFPTTSGGPQPGLSPRLTHLSSLAKVEADHLKDDYISTEHLLIAIADEDGRAPAA